MTEHITQRRNGKKCQRRNAESENKEQLFATDN